ncbi:hypothetical protein [Rhodobium gokarnense]|uniref:Uncharacterized protein n=1 Tax=Rhodobium gokarnense TaxID=364296 RepID=A0ABT3HH54_9HYPH|nr:hypothetical protein [Rhodobium gokarnense]MCW2309729.1 hypothetical protein [Rhodobium gokarnense]
MSDGPKLVNLGDKEKDEFAGALASAVRQMDHWRQLVAVIAERRRIAFDAYVAAGFTEQQALDLVKTHE